MSQLTVDIISDLVCPWCFIGARRVDQALEKAGIQGAKVTFHPFLLDPSVPAEGYDLRERLAKRFGGDPKSMFARVEDAAKSSGIPLDFEKVRRHPSTLKGHTLLKHVEESDRQADLARSLFAAYFLEGRDIGQSDVLVDIAVEHGIAREEAQALLEDEAALAATRAEALEASRQGISGVPFIVFNQALAVQGAQSVDILGQAIQQALAGR